MSNPFGFAVRAKDDTPVFLPLSSVTVKASIVDVSAQVELRQVFANSNAIENTAARYIFPVPAGAAVCAFRMEAADGTVVKAVVKELTRAQQEFEAAINEGKWAGLLEQIKGEVFVVTVGAVPVMQDVSVYITYVEELPQDDLVNQVRFTLPTHINERYGRAPNALSSATSENTDSARLEISINIQMASEIEHIHSPSHSISFTTPTDVRANDYPISTSTVTLDHTEEVSLKAKEFILTVQAANLNKPRCIAVADYARNSVAMSLTLVSQFGITPISSQEYVFVIDRSGSMRGQKMEYAKDALQVLLRSLPAHGTSFNVACFGNRHEFLWERSQVYGEASLRVATGYVGGMSADMGGTEIKGALLAAFSNRVDNIPTSVFVLTDGQVWDTNSVFMAVRGAVSNAGVASLGTYLRVFTLGIGSGASTDLCRGLARIGNGVCHMVHSAEDISSRCLNLLKAAKVPPIGNLWGMEIDWGHPLANRGSASDGGLVTRAFMDNETVSMQGDHGPEAFSFFDERANPNNDEHDFREVDPRLKFATKVNGSARLVKQAPAVVPDIYPYNRFVVSAILFDTTQIPSSVTLKGKMPAGEEVKMTFQVHLAGRENSALLHTLVARRLIADMQDGDLSYVTVPDVGRRMSTAELIKLEVVNLSEEYQLASDHAAFIAVEEYQAPRDEAERKAERATLKSGGDGHMSESDVHLLDPRSTFLRHAVDDDDTRTLDSTPFDDADVGSSRTNLQIRGLGGMEVGRNNIFEGHSERMQKPTPPLHIRLFTAMKTVQSSRKIATEASAYRPEWASAQFHTDSSVMERKGGKGKGAAWKSLKKSTSSSRYQDTLSGGNYYCSNTSGHSSIIGTSQKKDEKSRNERAAWPLQSFSFSRGSKAGDNPNVQDVENMYNTTGATSPTLMSYVHGRDSSLSSQSAGRVFQSAPAYLRRELEPVNEHTPAGSPTSAIENLVRVVPTTPAPAEIAKLQGHDGSFCFDERLVELLRSVNSRVVSLDSLRQDMQADALLCQQPSGVWATVLVASMMRKRMSETLDVWKVMWVKAKDYVIDQMKEDEHVFLGVLDRVELFV